MSVIEARPILPREEDEPLSTAGDGVITEQDELRVSIKDGEEEYFANLKPDKRDGVPIIKIQPGKGKSETEMYYLDSKVTSILVKNGEKWSWETVPERNIVTPRFTGEKVRIAILAAKEQRAQQ